MQTKHHHISEKQAREIALKRVKGKVIHVELEKDNGNTYYEVKMKASNNIYKLEIDTKTGKIVEIEKVNE
ncbi:hypothetical protein NG54_14305 [Heyndrickxia ginsengihumi]|nr:hypothetical protein NG54_14305 [Heyndrickxia ginsengihumi]